MDLEGDQIVGVDKYPVSHRGMAYGARRRHLGCGRKTKARALLRNTILETAVVNGSLVAPQVKGSGGPWPFRRRFMAVQHRERVLSTTWRQSKIPPLGAILVKVPCVL
jgi:hypothetical protein